MSHNIGTSLPTIITAVCCFRCAVSTTTCTPLSAVRNLSIYTVCHVRLKCGVRIVAVFKSKTYRFNQKLFDQNIFARTAHLISTATALTDSETIESSTTFTWIFPYSCTRSKEKIKAKMGKWESPFHQFPIDLCRKLTWNWDSHFHIFSTSSLHFISHLTYIPQIRVYCPD